MEINLSGKIALVTGATGELGRVICRTLAKCGADIVINYLKNEKAALLLKAEIETLGKKAIIVQADVTKNEEVIKMCQTVVKEMGAPHIIVNNAVIQYNWTNVLDQPLEDYESQFRSCVMQNVHMAKAFVPHMIEKNYGRFIAINTECTIQALPMQSAYVAGKKGMDGMLRVLAKEIGEHQITVNQVAPGWILSEKYRMDEDSYGSDYEKNVPLKRRGTDQEIANVVTFLASDLASFITGAYIPVNGGNAIPGL